MVASTGSSKASEAAAGLPLAGGCWPYSGEGKACGDLLGVALAVAMERKVSMAYGEASLAAAGEPMESMQPMDPMEPMESEELANGTKLGEPMEQQLEASRHESQLPCALKEPNELLAQLFAP